jgi:hypothetical protein
MDLFFRAENDRSTDAPAAGTVDTIIIGKTELFEPQPYLTRFYQACHPVFTPLDFATIIFRARS